MFLKGQNTGALLAACTLLLGCSTDHDLSMMEEVKPETCLPPAAPTPDIAYSAAADLAVGDCEPGSLASIDLGGTWWVVTEEPGATGYPSLYTDVCDQPSFYRHYTEKTDDYVYARTEYRNPFEESEVVSTTYKTCWNGTELTGTWARCISDLSADQGPNDPACIGDNCCDVFPVTIRRFTQPEGEQEASGLELVSVWSGSPEAPWNLASPTANVRVVDNYAYVARWSGLFIVDISNPAQPVDRGHYPSYSETINDLRMVRGLDQRLYAVMGSSPFGLVIVDVSDPTAPFEVRRLATPGGVHRFDTDTFEGQTWAYTASGWRDPIRVIDLTDPPAARLLGSYGNESDVYHGVHARNRVAYINAAEDGLQIVDFSQPSEPRVMGRAIEGKGYSHDTWVTEVGDRLIAVHGDEGPLSTVTLIDVDPDSPEFTAPLDEYSVRREVSVHNIFASGNRAYIAYYQNGVRVLDISEPTAPREIGYYNTWDGMNGSAEYYEGAYGITAANGLVFVTDTTRGLVILRDVP